MLTRPRVAVLCSQRAPGLAHLLARSAQADRSFDIVCCVTSDERFDEPLLARHGVPLLQHSVRAFYADHAPGRRLGDGDVRAAYDAATLRLLRAYSPDLIILAGYLLLLTPTFLREYPGRVINVHHSDLDLREGSGGPRYAGLRAVRDAIRAGERETRSSAHLVTERLDDGPVVARSGAYPVPDVARWALAAGDREVLRSAVWAHQEWMLRDAFGPLMERAVSVVAAGLTAPLLEAAS